LEQILKAVLQNAPKSKNKIKNLEENWNFIRQAYYRKKRLSAVSHENCDIAQQRGYSTEENLRLSLLILQGAAFVLQNFFAI